MFAFLGLIKIQKILKNSKNEGTRLFLLEIEIETINKIRLYSNEIQITRLDIENKNIFDYDFMQKNFIKD